MFSLDKELPDDKLRLYVSSIHDKMTEMPYKEPLQSFSIDIKPEVRAAVLKIIVRHS